MSTDIQTHEPDDRIIQLAARLCSLEAKVDAYRGTGSVIVPITSFDPEPYEVLREIKTVILPSDDEFIASFFDANLSAQGDTEQEAFNHLKDAIIGQFEILSQYPNHKLGPALKRQFAVLQMFLRKRG